MSSSSFLLSLTFAALTLVAKIIESRLFFRCFFFLIFFGLIERLGILGGSKHKNLRSFRSILMRIFYHFLSLDLICNSMSQSTFLETMLIYFSYVETWS